MSAGTVAEGLAQAGLFDALSEKAGKTEGQNTGIEEPQGQRAGPALQFDIETVLKRRPELCKVLSPPEIEIAKIIQRRVGQAQAIRIRDIAWEVFGQTVSQDEGYRERDLVTADRAVKAGVARLRELMHMPIAGVKVPPYGLFIPATAEEAKETHDRLFGEGIRLIVASQLFGRDRDLVRKLEGQLELVGSREE